MTNFTQTKLIRDMLGSDVPQYFNLDLQMFAVNTTDGSLVTLNDVDFAQTKLLRDALGSPIPQLWDPINNKWVVDDGSYGGSSGTITTISATNVIETTTKRFVTSDEKSQVTATADEVGSHSERIAVIENELQIIPTTDEKVKLTSSGIAGYLVEFIDGTTLQVVGGKLVVKSLDGLDVTINELNQLQGVTGPIQAQLDAFSSITNVSEIVNTENDLPTTVGPGGTTILVRADSTQDNASTFYTSNGTSWEFVNKIDSGLTRDFTTDPINLATETTNILPKNRYEKQTAAETPFFDASGKIIATNMQDAVIEAFQKSEDLRLIIASILGPPFKASDSNEEFETKLNQLNFDFTNNLASKGIVAHTYNTFAEKVAKILAIANITVAGTVKSTSKLNIVAPYSHQIVLNEPLKKEDIATSVLQHIPGTSGLTHYTANYNNGDASSFIYDPDEIVFENGFMTIKDTWEYALTQIGTDYWESDEIDFAQFVSVGADATIDVDTLKVTIKALKTTAAIAKASGDISINGVESLDQYIAIVQASGNGKVKKAISFDSGLTWWAYDGTQWVVVNVDSKADFGSKGTDIAIVNTLTNNELSVIRNNSNFVRHADYIERPTYNDMAKNDSLQLKVTMVGTNELVNVPYTYDEATKTLTHNFPQSGTFTINYVDAS